MATINTNFHTYKFICRQLYIKLHVLMHLGHLSVLKLSISYDYLCTTFYFSMLPSNRQYTAASIYLIKKHNRSTLPSFHLPPLKLGMYVYKCVCMCCSYVRVYLPVAINEYFPLHCSNPTLLNKRSFVCVLYALAYLFHKRIWIMTLKKAKNKNKSGKINELSSECYLNVSIRHLIH